MSRAPGTRATRHLPAAAGLAGVLAAALLAALLAGAALPGCSRAAPRPSVLLVTIDTLRADAVGAWGGEPGTTPAIDALCAQGTRFAQASTVTPLTLPAHASLLTGLRPARHGLTVNGVALPSLPVPTLAQRLRARGWATAAFVSSTVLDHLHGLSAGFDRYDDDLLVSGGPPVPTERRGDVTVDHALAWEGWSGEPFCAWVHLFDPHAPYDAPGAPASAASRGDRAAYLAEVRFADAQLARLLAAVRARARGPVLVVLAADHGEGLGEHGEETHGLLLHEATVHVPLVLAWLDAAPPGEAFPASGLTRSESVSLLDILPTVLDILGVPAEQSAGRADDADRRSAPFAAIAAAALDGRSLRTPAPGRALPLETRAPWVYYGFSPLVGVRRDGEKLVGAPRSSPPGWMLSRPADDPREERGEPVAQHALLGLLASPEPAREAAPAGDGEALSALGYVGRQASATAGAAADRALADPRAEQPFIAALDRANSALVAGHAEQALAELAGAETGHEALPELLLLRGKALLGLGRWDEAVQVLDRARGERPTADLLIECGRARLLRAQARGAPADDAVPALDAALAAAPGEPRAVALRALAEISSGDAAAALARLDGALADRPRDITLLSVKLQALVALSREPEAAALRATLATLWPEHPALHPSSGH